MELLAPAGSYAQAIAAMEAGCDALYGGMNQWNARDWAENFTMEAYSALLERCRKTGVRFYMTLNTLLRDDEVDEVCELLTSRKFPLPDAVIAADTGLICQLRKNIPELPIHASTQFGTYSVSDIQFLESLGVQRAILARELTLPEIRDIRQHTRMELEVFVYGSQCINFSGQCLWGSMTYGGSGNRGRCIGMCRDLYRCGSKKGQFMYPQYIDAVSALPSLNKIMVDSVKIEGRLRAPAEIAQAVHRFRNAIDALPARLEETGYCGYLQDRLPVQGMIRAVNARLKTSTAKAAAYRKEDLLCVDDPQPGIINGDEIKEGRCFRYIRTVRTSPFDRTRPNVSIKLKTDSHSNLTGLVFIDEGGERNLLALDPCSTDQWRTETIFSRISDRLKPLHLYELSASVPSQEFIGLDVDALDKILDHIASRYSTPANIEKCAYRFPTRENICIQSDTLEDIRKFSQKNYKKFIFEIRSYEEFKKTIEFDRQNRIGIIYKLPLFYDSDTLELISPLLKQRCVMVSRFSDIPYAARVGVKEIYADYSLNIWNRYSVCLAKEMGVKAIVAHPELSMESVNRLRSETGMPVFYIQYGRIPLGYTRACYGEADLCNHSCGNDCIEMENIEKRYTLRVLCESTFGYHMVLKTKIDITLDCPDDAICICNFIGMCESEKEIPAPESDVMKQDFHFLYRGCK